MENEKNQRTHPQKFKLASTNTYMQHMLIIYGLCQLSCPLNANIIIKLLIGEISVVCENAGKLLPM